MNQRINELWARAVDTAVPETYTSLSWAQIEKIKLVFAQLIVKECAELTLDYKSDDYYNGWLDYRDEIKEHFGVEE
jgi:hypothetical protein